MAMAEIRDSGPPFDCVAFCGAIQRMLNRAFPEGSFFDVSQKTPQRAADPVAAGGSAHFAETVRELNRFAVREPACVFGLAGRLQHHRFGTALLPGFPAPRNKWTLFQSRGRAIL